MVADITLWVEAQTFNAEAKSLFIQRAMYEVSSALLCYCSEVVGQYHASAGGLKSP